jgi:hypothetical protein
MTSLTFSKIAIFISMERLLVALLGTLDWYERYTRSILSFAVSAVLVLLVVAASATSCIRHDSRWWQQRLRRSRATEIDFYNKVDLERLKLLDCSSRGLTAIVSDAVKLQWIRSLILWNKSPNGERPDVESWIRLLGGAIWFRFHVTLDCTTMADDGHAISLPASMTCHELLRWAFGQSPHDSPCPASMWCNKDIYALVVASVDALVAIGLAALDEVVVEMLLQTLVEWKERENSHDLELNCLRVRQLIGYLRFLHALAYPGGDRLTVLRIRCLSWQPQRSRNCQQSTILFGTSRNDWQPFLERLERHVERPTGNGDGSHVVRCLARMYTNLGLHAKAIALWAETAAIWSSYASPSPQIEISQIRSNALNVQAWIADGVYIMESMNSGLACPDSMRWKNSLVRMSQTLSEQRLTSTLSQTGGKDISMCLDWADSLTALASYLLHCGAWSEALQCWDQTRDLLEPCLTRCCLNVSARLWYVGIAFGARINTKELGALCLIMSKQLSKTPSTNVLCETLQLVMYQPMALLESVSTSDQDWNGVEFAMNSLWDELEMTRQVCDRLAHVVGYPTFYPDDIGLVNFRRAYDSIESRLRCVPRSC